MSDPIAPDRDAWARLIADIDLATHGELISGLQDRLDITAADATDTLDDAIKTGVLVADESDSAFTEWIVADTDETTTEDAETDVATEPNDEQIYEAFAEVIDYCQQLDRPLPDDCEYETPRAALIEGRGWDPQTISDKQLGYAPGSQTALLDHLMVKGYDRETILGTGLFWDDLTPIWMGRHVWPYFDTDGEQPVYAIARTMGHPADTAGDYGDGPAKYHKIPTTREEVTVEEPIYGRETIVNDAPLIITEGIADAITAHEAGYPCISPVTKQFKKQHHSVLLDLIEEHDIPRVYILQDAEVATINPKDTVDDEPPSISEALHIEQHGEGLRGAIETAAYLDDNDVPAFIGEFPRPGTEKVDLDDWLQEWGETLGPILKSAKPVDEHRAFDPKKHAIESASEHPDPDPPNSDGRRSALFDLDVQDVTGLGWDDRTENPLGHHGSSENYFLLVKDKEVAYDHKYKVAYTALTYLLCEAGERRADSPNGRLNDSEILAAWLHAKQERHIPDDDPIPHRALRSVAIKHDLCEQDAIQGGWKLPRAAYDDAIEIVEEKHGVDSGREPIADGWTPATDDDGEDEDLTELAVVLDPERAWRAAGQISPDDLRVYDDLDAVEPLTLAVTDDESGWCCPQCGGAVGIVQAVAIDRGTIDCCEQPLRDDDYDTAYYRARTGYGAPLPEYVSTETATDNWALVQGAVSQLTHHHLSGTESTVTSDGGDGDDVIAELDPCWADSASGQRIVAFRSGNFYCREHERALDPLRFVALEHGIIEDCNGVLEGENFTRAYHIAREQYGAPLPDWETGAPDHVPVLPDADDLLGEFATDTDTLADARDEVTELVRSRATDATKASVVTTLPALGKTTAIVILADEQPALYLAPRKELMAEVADKAEKWGRSCQHLPIFAATPPTDGAIAEALELVRGEDKQVLRHREDLVERIETPIQDDGNDKDEDDDADSLPTLDPETEYPTVESARDDGYRSLSAARRAIEAQNTQRAAMADEQSANADDEIDLDRASCPCANGDHGAAWQLVVAVARALGHTPQEIHTRDEQLFGETLPCHADGDCEYALGWERATDPGAPKDILIGHYGHGHVNGARVHRARDADEHVRTTHRTIAIDEFPGDTYDRIFDEEFVDHAAWAASAICPEVDDRQALFERDLGEDETLRAWIDGNATDENKPFAAIDGRLNLMGELTDAYTAAKDTQETLAAIKHGSADEGEDEVESAAVAREALIDALDEIIALAPKWDGDALEAAYTTLRAAVADAADHIELYTACNQIQNEILPALASGSRSIDADERLSEMGTPDHCGTDLTELVETAITASCEQRDGAQGFIHAARTALAGGEDGCRELAIHSDDGYAHPMAYLLLDGLISETDEADETGPSVSGNRSIIATDSFDFEDDDADGENGTNLARTCNGRHTILTDRNHHGALIRDPPAFQGDDEAAPNPIIGLDATGRKSLWELAIGCPVETADIHETPRKKRAFLRDVLNLQVVQTSPHVQSYSGSPDSTNFDGPVALVNQIAEEYSASLLRRDTLSSTTKPGTITTKKAQGAIEGRISGVSGAIEHYGDITGSNALGDHNLGIVLGSRHYGDAPVEKWAALAGQTVTRDGKGADLDYGCPIGNAFLKYMREDETLQAILRFGRDEEGAVVFAHTSALAECLPVVAEGQVVKAFTENGKAITEVARQYRGRRFEISDLVDDVDCSRETVRRTLNEFAEFGYLTKHETKNGLATGYESLGEPGAGEVELPELDDPFNPDGPPDRGGSCEDEALHKSPITRLYTWNVEVGADEQGVSPRRKSRRATLPAPEKIAAGPPPN